MDQSITDILLFEKETPLTWYDWWSYWAPFIGILLFLISFLFLTICYYSIGKTQTKDN